MANPSGNGTNNHDAAHPSHHSGSSVPEPVLQQNPSVSVDWTPDEQSILEDGLAQYASEPNIIRYAKIAVQLQNKTVREVALRCRWMFKRNIGKRSKEDYILTRKSKDRKEIMNEHLPSTSHLSTQSGSSSYVPEVVGNGQQNDIIYSVLSSPAGQLLKETAKALDQISLNLETHQVHDNISLLYQVQKNIQHILNNLSDTPEKLRQMPPLPVKLNEALFNYLLPQSPLQLQMQ
ncbi:hypothetical protein L2E82_44965 [Cichorium intybus]|uniref:Uncharacterized protein n=1 Tax=Cichorium intybus TaxID=13427 RepID=A0ACB8ZRK4_CICIN|nr:hypothetical protein L2E82_44965 [Cichorium intybus]